MVSLLDLPEELLVRIIEIVKIDFEKESRDGSVRVETKEHLLALARTDRKLNRLATPHIYESVNFPGQSHEEDRWCCMALVYLMLTSLEHARMVRKVVLAQYDMKIEVPEHLADVAETGIRNAIDSLSENAELRQLFKDNIWHGSDEDKDHETGNYCLLLLVIMCLPKLQVLEFDGWYSQDDMWPHIEEVIKIVGLDPDKPGFLGAVREVHVEGSGDKYPDSPRPLAIFARIPWIEHLSGSCLGDEDTDATRPGKSFKSLTPGCSNIETLTISPRSKLHHLNMDQLLQAPKGLRIFTYCAGHAWAWVTFKARWLNDSLRHQRHSLEEISITLDDYDDFGSADEEDTVTPMTFSSFTALEVLEISHEFVFGPDAFHIDGPGEDVVVEVTKEQQSALKAMLPPQIQQLKLMQCDRARDVEVVKVALVELLQTSSVNFKQLHRIELHIGMHGGSEDGGKRNAELLETLDACREQARDVGIKLAVFNCGKFVKIRSKSGVSS